MKKAIILAIIFIIFSFLPIYYKADAAVPIGNYLILNGGYLKATTNFRYSPGAFTFEAWVKPESVSGIQNIISIGDKSIKSFHYEVGINGGSLSLNYHYGLGSQKIITAGSLSPNIWNHIAVTVSSFTTKMFINGQQIFSTLGASPLLPVGENIAIGVSYLESFVGENPFKGEIDEVRISEIERDIAALWSGGTYQSVLPVDEHTLILWHLDETRGQLQAFDSSGNDFHGILIGGDSKIHFFGILPTPTPLIIELPILRWERPILPTISLPSRTIPKPTSVTATTKPTILPSPTTYQFQRSYRPVYPR